MISAARTNVRPGAERVPHVFAAGGDHRDVLAGGRKKRTGQKPHGAGADNGKMHGWFLVSMDAGSFGRAEVRADRLFGFLRLRHAVELEKRGFAPDLHGEDGELQVAAAAAGVGAVAFFGAPQIFHRSVRHIAHAQKRRDEEGLRTEPVTVDFRAGRGASGGAADDQRGAAKRPAGSSDGVQETFGSQDYRRRTRKIQKLAEPEILPTFEELDADVPF